MSSVETNDSLNQLAVILGRSLPMYLSYASPFTMVRNGQAEKVLSHIVADERHLIERIGETIIESGGSVEQAEFPMTFTAYHDLSFQFLLSKLIEYQKRDIKEIEQCVWELRLAPMAKALAEEVAGLAKGHLDTLQELAAKK